MRLRRPLTGVLAAATVIALVAPAAAQPSSDDAAERVSSQALSRSDITGYRRP